MQLHFLKHKHMNPKHSSRYHFIAQHRGGPLSLENHRKLCSWARTCCEHALANFTLPPDQRLTDALHIAQQWEQGLVTTGAAMKAAVAVHRIARESKDPVFCAVARAIGHTVATAHMADHSLGGPFYMLKAMNLAHIDIYHERTWQIKKLHELPPELVAIVVDMWQKKGFDKKN